MLSAGKTRRIAKVRRRVPPAAAIAADYHVKKQRHQCRGRLWDAGGAAGVVVAAVPVEVLLCAPLCWEQVMGGHFRSVDGAADTVTRNEVVGAGEELAQGVTAGGQPALLGCLPRAAWIL
ncbi:hypothetical protein Pelo_18170 [Pelomyxa schiedti]|nr:hypothetical protein Pelo_18170 [Pelomyxa schiedti]